MRVGMWVGMRVGGCEVVRVGTRSCAGAGDRVERLLSDFGFSDVTITPDLAGRDRVAEGRWSG